MRTANRLHKVLGETLSCLGRPGLILVFEPQQTPGCKPRSHQLAQMGSRLDDVIPLRELVAAAGKKVPMLFAPAAAWRVRRSTNTDTPLPGDEPAGQNPPDGAIIDYNLVRDAHGPVVLEVLDSQGNLLRRYSSEDPVAPTLQQLRTNLIPPMWPQMRGPLRATAGMHRWVWDLRAMAPTATHYEYPISAVPHRTPLEPQGPLVVPGTYMLRLTVEGHSESAPLTVKMDPRVHTSMADLEALHAAQTAMAASLDALAKANLAAHSVTDQLSAPENASLAAQLAPFRDTLKTLLDGTGPKTPRPLPGIEEVASEATELYSQLQRADVAPTAALLAAAAQVQDEGKEVLPGWEDFKEKQLPALNEKLRDAHRPAINLIRQPEDMPQSGDEE